MDKAKLLELRSLNTDWRFLPDRIRRRWIKYLEANHDQP
jgi:hypothetical protein